MHPIALHRRTEAGRTDGNADRGANVAPKSSPALVTSGRVDLPDSHGTLAGTQAGGATMMAILPVKVRSPDGYRVATSYAFLDLGSSASFCTPSLLKRLGVEGDATELSLTSVSAENEKTCSRVVRWLKISGRDDGAEIPMPPTFTLGSIPVRQEDVVSSDDVSHWGHCMVSLFLILTVRLRF